MTEHAYLDHAATTPVDPAVMRAMLECLGSDGVYGNPSSTHATGRAARARVEQARRQVAALIGAAAEEIVFTSGATEADNLAILGAARFRRAFGAHVVTAVTEHPAVVESCRALEREGFSVTWLRPDQRGIVTPEALQAALTDDTILVSLMHVNNEIGVVQDIAGFGRVCRAHGALLHVDAAQSAGREPILVRDQCVDLLSLSAHKIYGPKGVGALFIDAARLRRVTPLMFGGGQERGIRPGTIPVHQVVGLGAACELARERRVEDEVRIRTMRDLLWAEVSDLPGISRNVAQAPTASHILSISVSGVHGEMLLRGLDDLAVSGGAACASDSDEVSQVLRSIGLSDQLADSTLRLSVGRGTTHEEIQYAGQRLRETIAELRSWSPLTNPLGAPPAGTVQGAAGDPGAGARVEWRSLLDAGQIVDAEFRVFGCPDTLAACRWLTGRISGKPVSEALAVGVAELAEACGAAPEKRGSLLIVLDALRNGFADWDNIKSPDDPDGEA